MYILSFRFSSQKWSGEHVFLSPTLPSAVVFSRQYSAIISVVEDFLKTLGRKDFVQYNFSQVILG